MRQHDRLSACTAKAGRLTPACISDLPGNRPRFIFIFLVLSTVCVANFFESAAVFAFPMTKDKLLKSLGKEKLPPPIVIRDKWAVLIGLTKYQDGKIAPLKHTTANLALLTKVLKDPNGGRFVDDHITTLFDVQATKKYAEYLLTEGWLIKKALPNDLILLYVCGRASFTDDDAILCTYESVANSPSSTGLSLKALLAEIHRRTQSKNIICISDLSPLSESTTDPAGLWQNIANAAKVTILAASAPGQPSYQSNTMGSTLFTRYFADGLQAGGGAMSINDVAQYVCQSTEADAKSQLQKQQRPQFVLLPENKEFGTVAIGVPIKSNLNSQSRVAFGHPLDQLALTRPDLMPHAPRASVTSRAVEGAKNIAKKEDPEEDDDSVQDLDFSGYMTKMKKDVQAKWKPPKGIEQRKVVVIFTINRDGSISEGSVVDSSGVESIDKSALDALHDASPLDPLPKGAPKSVQIRYQFDWRVTH
jgi:TonB family protein